MPGRILLKSEPEVARIRAACAVVAKVLDEVRAAVRPGVSTADLDRIAHDRTLALGAAPAFLGYRKYPASLCVSINEEIVHGIPSPRRLLREGDVVGLDFGAVLDGFYGDAAVSVGVGEISREDQRLIDVTREALARAVAAARPGNRVGDIGRAVQDWVESQGFSVVRAFVGHGIGRALHEPPHVPNYAGRGMGEVLAPGMVLAIEPMVNAGTFEARLLDDGWTAVTADGRRSAHFEHTVLVGPRGPEALTDLSG
jgi:methionyl aminopeptidase